MLTFGKIIRLANRESVSFDDLADYPNMTFDQGDNSTLYFAEELFADINHHHMIKVNDRATMLNLMQGLFGYTVCSGIICEELNGDAAAWCQLKMNAWILKELCKSGI